MYLVNKYSIAYGGMNIWISQNMFIVEQLNFIWFIENLIIITEDLFDGIQPLINWRITAYLKTSSVKRRYNRFCAFYLIAPPLTIDTIFNLRQSSNIVVSHCEAISPLLKQVTEHSPVPLIILMNHVRQVL